jgi:hypothetical protein
MLIIDVSEVKLPGEAKQYNLPPECGQPIGVGVGLDMTNVSFFSERDLNHIVWFPQGRSDYTLVPEMAVAGVFISDSHINILIRNISSHNNIQSNSVLGFFTERIIFQG